MKKRILGVLLALVMALSVLPTMAWADETLAGGEKDGSYAADGTVLLNNTITVKSGKTLTLSGAGTIKRNGFTGAMIEVKSGGKLVIDGVTLDGNKTSGVATKSVIEINAGGEVLMNSGKICNNKASLGGGVNNMGAFTMKNGSICDNEATHGGGVQNGPEGSVDLNATFKFEGGTICDNKTVGGNGTGGGIRNRGTLTMQDGCLIKDNYAENGGAGVFNYNGVFTMTGGTITGNVGEKRGGGVAHRNGSSGAFNISGDPKIFDNYRVESSGRTIDNVELISSGGEGNRKSAISNITIVGAMASDANVGVRVWPGLTTQSDLDTENGYHTYIKFGNGYGANDDDLKFFHVDNGEGIFFKNSEKVILAMASGGENPAGDTVTVTFVVEDGTPWGKVEPSSVTVPVGSKIGFGEEGSNTIKVGDETVTIMPQAEDEQYTYEFLSYECSVNTDDGITEDAIVTVYFKRTEKTVTEPEPAAPEQPTPAPVPGHSGVNRRFPAKTESGTEVTSAKTFDGGVAVYAALALVSAGGTALVQRKWED